MIPQERFLFRGYQCKNEADGLHGKIALTFRAGLEEPALGQNATNTACFTAVRSRQDADYQRCMLASMHGDRQRR